MSSRPPFDKYDCYRRAVQDPQETCAFLEGVYREAFRCAPLILREDFCGTFAVACEWVRRNPRHAALALDKDRAPLRYGERKAAQALQPAQRERLQIRRMDVLRGKLPESQIACALNFSYFTFHDRKRLRAYLARCHASLARRGVLLLDCLGAVQSTHAVRDEVDYGDFIYTWEQAAFDPISRRALFHIHFQRSGERRRSEVFTYDWRLWTVPELRELLEEVGFRRTRVYWQGNEESWVAYIAALK